ncbi:XRE family transcriptional regulator [Dorea sp. D27]|uniref:XRE family transcriptional regulator n=1 Tax=Dorea sp. D27 TaxID=658665 RepID=UPI0006731633|nr:helix-turn-helix domain-containing protein [Dorea sp. D27]
MTLGDILKRYREENNISMDEFSRKSSLSKGYISMLENNINPRNKKPIAPTLPTIKKIATGIGLDVDTLLKMMDSNQEISLEHDELYTQPLNNIHQNMKCKCEDTGTTIGDKLKKIREKTSMNKKEFASYLGVKYTTYNGYETGNREPASDFLILISKKMDVSVDYIMGLTDEKDIMHSYELKSGEYEHIKKYRLLSERGKEEIVDFVLNKEYERCKTEFDRSENIVQLEDTKTIPYYQRLASAGPGQLLLDGLPDDTINIPNIHKYKHVGYAIGVNGNSMEPAYFDGDTILVEPTNYIDEGEIGIFLVDGKSYVKKKGDGILISLNDDCDDVSILPDSRCLGRVIDVYTQEEDFEVEDTLETSLERQHKREQSMLEELEKEALKKGAAAVSKKGFKAIDGGKSTI